MGWGVTIGDCWYSISSSNLRVQYPIGAECISGSAVLPAIQLANERFNSSSHRKNVKPVIVIIATAYKAGNNFDPVTTAANAFKQNGGIIITYEFHQKDSLPVDILEKLASKGYHVSNRPGANALSPERIPDLFAKANCFCPADYIPYVLNGTYEPNYGCYRAATTTTSQVSFKPFRFSPFT
ncbi:hypothetical protein ANCCAN_03754 [Ancylostoma caninum]|uniref:VWFA domain-containing protein n=1 Tax=Ancylostoma caninum TaxID=29170 RepID=A0A368H3E1_ANCCA|nr:hypothetical protein ANCCAN_03754 [Ancylostoma caninum]